MLPERVFTIGGWLCIATSALLAAAIALNPSPFLWYLIPTVVLFLGLGAFFLYVGLGARRDRRRLLESPERPS
jgi:O-antigen ligase